MNMAMTNVVDTTTPQLLTAAMIRKQFLPVGSRTFERWLSMGRFPRPDIRLGERTRFWRRETVLKWIEDQSQGGVK